MSERSRAFLFSGAYLLVYAAALIALIRLEKFSPEEPLAMLAIFGIFSLLAWVVTRKAQPLAVETKGVAPLLLYLVAVAAFITLGFPENAFLKMAVKLLAFVVLPMILFRTRLRFAWTRRDTVAAVVVGVALTVLQIFLGSGPRRIAALHLTPAQIAFAALGAFLWMSVEAGLVEEYFFRAALQTRLERVLQSSAGGIVLAALLFGLAHSPGLYLRTGLTNEPLSHPSLLTAIGYSIVMLSPAGIFFGVLWTRTRNLLLVGLLHGVGDLLPNIPDFLRTFRIG